MGLEDIFFWPFSIALAGTAIVVLLLVAVAIFIFWVWMIIDAAQRKFRNDAEKVIWILIIVFMQWLGALIYFLVVKMYNPKGLFKK